MDCQVDRQRDMYDHALCIYTHNIAQRAEDA